MEKIRFMRLLLFFDLPTLSNADKREYRHFVKFLESDGYVRVQFSVYAKLCINSDSAETCKHRLLKKTTLKGDIRFMIITERQYQNIVNINKTFNLQDELTTIDRSIMIGGMNDET